MNEAAIQGSAEAAQQRLGEGQIEVGGGKRIEGVVDGVVVLLEGGEAGGQLGAAAEALGKTRAAGQVVGDEGGAAADESCELGRALMLPGQVRRQGGIELWDRRTGERAAAPVISMPLCVALMTGSAPDSLAMALLA